MNVWRISWVSNTSIWMVMRSDTQEFYPSTVTLADELHKRLVEAAELYWVPKLREYLDEMAQLDPKTQQLARHLRQFIESYDMDSILSILGEIAHE